MYLACNQPRYNTWQTYAAVNTARCSPIGPNMARSQLALGSCVENTSSCLRIASMAKGPTACHLRTFSQKNTPKENLWSHFFKPLGLFLRVTPVSFPKLSPFFSCHWPTSASISPSQVW